MYLLTEQHRHNLTMANRAYLWKSPHSYLFPKPFEPVDIDLLMEEISPFPYTIDMKKETTKTTAVSMMKNLEWLHQRRESQPFVTSTGEDFFALEKRQRKRMLETAEQAVWDELMGAADKLSSLKRARFQSPTPKTPPPEKKIYRKTPPGWTISPSLRMSQASRRSSPSPSSSSPPSSVLRSLEQTSQSTKSALVR